MTVEVMCFHDVCFCCFCFGGQAPDADLHFEGGVCVGPDAIHTKMMVSCAHDHYHILMLFLVIFVFVQGLPFKHVQHAVTTTDSTVIGNGLLIMVVGQLKVSHM